MVYELFQRIIKIETTNKNLLYFALIGVEQIGVTIVSFYSILFRKLLNLNERRNNAYSACYLYKNNCK